MIAITSVIKVLSKILLLFLLVTNILPRGAESGPVTLSDWIFSNRFTGWNNLFKPISNDPKPCTADYGILDAMDDLLDLDETSGCNFLKGEVPFYDDTCVKLLEQGPCERGHWLVVDDDEIKCDKEECADGYVKYNDECVSLSSNPCESTFELMINEQGEGECRCPPGSLYHKDTEKCYVAYSQGPCRRGEIIKLKIDSKGGYGKCKKNPCPREKMVPMDKHCNTKDSVSSKAKCYDIGTNGPCRDGSFLLIEPSLCEPFCLNKQPNSIVPRIIKRSTTCSLSNRNYCNRSCSKPKWLPYTGDDCNDGYRYSYDNRRRIPLCRKSQCPRRRFSN